MIKTPDIWALSYIFGGHEEPGGSKKVCKCLPSEYWATYNGHPCNFVFKDLVSPDMTWGQELRTAGWCYPTPSPTLSLPYSSPARLGSILQKHQKGSSLVPLQGLGPNKLLPAFTRNHGKLHEFLYNESQSSPRTPVSPEPHLLDYCFSGS